MNPTQFWQFGHRNINVEKLKLGNSFKCYHMQKSASVYSLTGQLVFDMGTIYFYLSSDGYWEQAGLTAEELKDEIGIYIKAPSNDYLFKVYNFSDNTLIGEKSESIEITARWHYHGEFKIMNSDDYSIIDTKTASMRFKLEIIEISTGKSTGVREVAVICTIYN